MKDYRDYRYFTSTTTKKPSVVARIGAWLLSAVLFAGLLASMLAYFDVLVK